MCQCDGILISSPIFLITCAIFSVIYCVGVSCLLLYVFVLYRFVLWSRVKCHADCCVLALTDLLYCRLSKLVAAPKCVSDLDWVSLYWPTDRVDEWYGCCMYWCDCQVGCLILFMPRIAICCRSVYDVGH